MVFRTSLIPHDFQKTEFTLIPHTSGRWMSPCTSCPSLNSILFVFTCCYLLRVACKDQLHCSVSTINLLLPPTTATFLSGPPVPRTVLPRTFPFSPRQNKLIRSEVRAYQQGISIQIKALSGHKQQEAKHESDAAEWEDGRGTKRGRAREGILKLEGI